MILRLMAIFALSGAALLAQALIEGRPGSPVRAVIYEDLACSDCANFRVMMDQQILPKYAGRVEFLHRDVPLAKHPWSRKAAIAARFFHEKDPKLGLEFRRFCFSQIGKMTLDTFNEKLSGFAREHQVKPEDAVAALDDPRLAALVEKDFQDGVGRGIAKTPTVLVNGTPFIETFTFEELSKALDEALK